MNELLGACPGLPHSDQHMEVVSPLCLYLPGSGRLPKGQAIHFHVMCSS